MKTFIYPATPINTTGLSTSAGQAAELAELQSFHADNTTENQALNNTLTDFSQKSASALVTVPYNNTLITYVTSGNGVGEIETVVYKLNVTTVATLTLTYDANNKLSTVVKS